MKINADVHTYTPNFFFLYVERLSVADDMQFEVQNLLSYTVERPKRSSKTARNTKKKIKNIFRSRVYLCSAVVRINQSPCHHFDILYAKLRVGKYPVYGGRAFTFGEALGEQKGLS